MQVARQPDLPGDLQVRRLSKVVVVAWRTARALEVLLAEVDAAAPGRRRASDGTIGDRAHSERESDHNPDANGVVRALDVSHDPAGGHDCSSFAEHLRSRALTGDRRVKYVIWNRQICSASKQWQWRAYRGDNPHDTHLHLSVTSEADDSDAPWGWANDGDTRWSHEFRPVQQLPLILCGPIVRRVQSHQVSVFVALREPRHVELVIHESTDPVSPVVHSHSSLGLDLPETVPLGRHLHVLVVTLAITSQSATLLGLEPGRTYGYDLRLRARADEAGSTGLADDAEGLLQGPHALGYLPGHLPGFTVAPLAAADLHLVHGSCRKPHGGGRDMLAALDDVIVAGGSPPKRPHVLLLTGDQIYADDVAVALLRTLHASARELLGWRETLGPADLVVPELGQRLAQVFAALQDVVELLVPATDPVDPQPVTTALVGAVKSRIDGLLALVGRAAEQLPEPDTAKERLTRAIALVLLRRQLEAHRRELHAQVEALVTSGDRASREQLLELHQTLGDLQQDLLSMADSLRQMASDSSWGGLREEPAPDGGEPRRVFHPSRIAPPQRAAELRQLALLTSDEMDGHLMFLGEWYLMYLFAWSDVLWPRLPASGPVQYTLAEPKAAVPNYSLIGKLRPDAIEQSRRKVLEFAAGLPRVRRVLANVPTYMIFDDHEVTDDWNLHEDWVRLVHTSPAGPAVIRNALAAYAVFQDWGNQPDDYLPGRPGRLILDALSSPTSSLGEPQIPAAVVASPGGNGPLDEVLSLGARALDVAEHRYDAARKQWSYVVDPHPRDPRQEYQVVLLDTRTCRGFPAGSLLDQLVSHLKVLLRENLNPALGLVGPSALLSEPALERQLDDTLRDGLVNVVVSPAPVFGLPLVEDVLQQVLVAKDNPEVADNEAWQANPDAFQRLFDRLAGQDVVLVSGDVHYGFSNDVRVRTAADPTRPGRLVQLCSSALKNESAMTVMLGVVGRRGTREEFWDLGSPENSRRIQSLLESEVRDLEESVRSFSETDLRTWLAETPLFVDPMQAYLRLKTGSLFNLPNLLPASLRAMAVGTVGLRNLFASAQGGGVFAEERFTVHFLRDDAAAEYPDVVGCNNLGRVRLLPGAGRPLAHVRHELRHYPHPHPDASLAAATTTHGTQPRWEYVKREMARLAEEEVLRWRTPAGKVIEETSAGNPDPYAQAVLEEYYRVAGLGPPVWGGNELYWSAAFISYLVTLAGGAEAFGPSARHIDYIRRAKRNRTAGDDSNPFWLYDVTEHAPQVGDLVCIERPPKDQQGHRPLTYADVDEQGTQFRPAHCDVVVEVTGTRLRTIGGNVKDSVGENVVHAVPGTGRVDVTKHPKHFAVLAVRTDV